MSRTSDGLYQRRRYWYFKYKNARGLWVERACRTCSYTEAKKIKAAFLHDLQDGNLPNERSRWTLKQAIEQWLVDRKHRIGAGSYASEATITKNLLRVLGSETRLENLTDIQVLRRYESSRLGKGIKAKTINNEMGVLAGILRDAKLWRRVEPDYKRLPVQKSDIAGALTREEAYRLVQITRITGDDAVAPFVALLSYCTGMRSKEIKNLQIGSIHLDGGNPQIQVKRATTKTNRGARYVALDRMATWALFPSRMETMPGPQGGKPLVQFWSETAKSRLPSLSKSPAARDPEFCAAANTSWF